MDTSESFWTNVIVVFLTLGPPLFFGDLVSFSSQEAKHGFSMLQKWGRVGLVAALVMYWEARPLSSIGLHPPQWRDFLHGIGTLAVLLVLNSLLQSALSAAGIGMQAGEVIQNMSSMSLLVNAAVALTAGITEEILYRGVAIERLEELTGSVTVAAILPALVFVGVHIPVWGWGTGLVQLGYVAVFTGGYLYTRRLAPLIIAHVLLDSIGLVIYPALS